VDDQNAQPTTLVKTAPFQVELAVPRDVRRKRSPLLVSDTSEGLTPKLRPSALMDVIATVTGAAAPTAWSCTMSPIDAA
jgi:hypothetical protein